ncbi:MAG TPA: outer membrane beta-barrel protein [Balneolaceae bacterium]
MKKLLLLPLFLFLCSPFLVQAQDYDEDDDAAVIENAFGIGPRFGYYHGSEIDDGTFYYGLQARLRLGGVIGLEGSVSYRPGTERNLVTDQGDVSDQFYETKFVPVTGSLMLFIPVDGFAPYGLAGVGAYYTFYGDGAPDNWDPTFNFGYHLGFGLEIPFSDDVALSLDYRYIFLTPEGEGQDAPEDADFSGNVFTGGLMFYL